MGRGSHTDNFLTFFLYSCIQWTLLGPFPMITIGEKKVKNYQYENHALYYWGPEYFFCTFGTIPTLSEVKGWRVFDTERGARIFFRRL